MAYKTGDGTLTIFTNVDTKGLSSGLAGITKTMNKLTGTMKMSFGIAGFIALGKAAVNAASDLAEYRNVAEATFGKLVYKLDEFNEKCIESYGMSELTATQIASSFQAMGKSIGLAKVEAADMSITLTGVAGDFASFYNISQEQARRGLSAIYTGETETLKQYGLMLQEVNLQQYENDFGMGRSVKTMDAAQKTMLRYNYVMRALGEDGSNAIGDFVRTQNQWANQVRILQERWKQFLTVLGTGLKTVFAPVIVYLNQAASAVIRFSRAVGDALTNIFGIKWDTSTLTDTSDSFHDIADGATDATGATKKLAKATRDYLSPIDEINRYTSSNKDEGDNGGTGVVGSVDLDAIDDGMGKIAEKVKSDIETLFELGQFVRDKIVDSLNSIDWEMIKSKAEKFSRGIAEFLNGLFSPDENGVYTLGKAIGNFIAEAMNTGLTLAFGFADELNWHDLGMTIATSVNEFFATFDFALLANTIDAWIQGIFEMIYTAITEIEWDKVWEGVKEFFANLDPETVKIIIGFITLKALFSKAFSKMLFEAFKSGILKAFGVETFGKLFSNALSNVFSAGINLFKTTIPNVFSPLIASIKHFFATGGFPALATSIKAGFETMFYNLSLGNTLNASMSYAFGGLATTVAGVVSIIAGAVAAVASFFSMWKNGFSWLKEILMVIGTALAALGAVILGVAAAPAAIVAAIVAAVATLVIVVKDNWEAIKEFTINAIKAIGEFFSTIGQWIYDNVIEPVVSFFVGLGTRVADIFRGLWIIIKAIWIIVSTWFDNVVIQPVVGFFTRMGQAIQTIFQLAITFIKTLWSTVSNWFNNTVVQPLVNYFAPIVAKISGFFSSMWNGIKAIWVKVATWFDTTVIQPVQKAWQMATTAIAGFFTNLWDGITNGVKGAMNGVIGAIEWAINGIVDLINGILSGFNVVVSAAAKITGDSWSGVSLVPKVSIPRLATGAVIPPNSPFMAMLGDQKSGTNIEAPLDTIKQALAEVIAGVSGNLGGNGTQTVNLVLDGMVVAKTVIKNGKVLQTITGGNPFELA